MNPQDTQQNTGYSIGGTSMPSPISAPTTPSAPISTPTPTPTAQPIQKPQVSQPTQPTQSTSGLTPQQFTKMYQWTIQNPNTPHTTEINNQINKGNYNDIITSMGLKPEQFGYVAPPQTQTPSLGSKIASSILPLVSPVAGALTSDVGKGAVKEAVNMGTSDIANMGARVGNVVGDALNYLTGKNVPPSPTNTKTFQQNGTAQKIGGLLTDLGAFFIPGGAEKAAIGDFNGAIDALKFTGKTAEESAALKSLLKIVSTAGVTGAASGGVSAIESGGAAVPTAIGTGVGAFAGGAGQGLKEFAPNFAPDALKSSEEIAKAKDDAASKYTWEMIKSKLTPTEQVAARKAGQITEEGLLKTTTHNPSASDKEMIEVAKPFVSNAKNADEAIANMKQGKADEAVKLRAGLEKTPGTWSKSDAIGALNKAKVPMTLKGDLSKMAASFKKAIVELASNAEKTNAGKLDLRQGIDSLVNDEFPSNIYSKDTPIGQYIRNVRTSFNKFLENGLPEGKTADGISYADSLRKQTLLFDAIDNASANAPKIGSNIITRNPVVSGAIKAGAKAAGLGAGFHLLP